MHKKSHTGKTATTVARGINAVLGEQFAGAGLRPADEDNAAYAREQSRLSACCRRMGSAITGEMERTKRGPGCD